MIAVAAVFPPRLRMSRRASGVKSQQKRSQTLRNLGSKGRPTKSSWRSLSNQTCDRENHFKWRLKVNNSTFPQGHRSRDQTGRKTSGSESLGKGQRGLPGLDLEEIRCGDPRSASPHCASAAQQRGCSASACVSFSGRDAESFAPE